MSAKGDRKGRATRVLVLTDNGAASYRLEENAEAVIGRHRDCDIVVGLPSMSRRHARLCAVSTRAPHDPVMIEDIGGMNGVLVRGHPIPRHVPVAVNPGDIVEVGEAILVLHAGLPLEAEGATDLRSAGPVARASTHRSITDDPMRLLDRLIEVVAGSDVAVLLLGESGVGKTVVAEAIHALSRRARGPRHRLECGGPPKLVERQLFGTEDSPGLLETMTGGTLILREVADLPLPIQGNLAAAITERRASRIGVGGGSATSYPVDVRIVALSRQDLLGATLAGRFDPTLYEALAGITVVLPPLRERAGEIPRFAARFLAEAAARIGRSRPRLSNDALGVLIRHPFPGNLRELRTLMDRASALAGAGFIGSEHLLFESKADHPTLQTATTRRFTPIAPTEPPESPTEPVSVVIPGAPRAMPDPAPPPPPPEPVRPTTKPVSRPSGRARTAKPKAPPKKR